LLDQFTRNLGRGTAEAFAGDDKALATCQAARERGDDQALRFIERAFLCMPMMHAENREVAEQSKAYFAKLSADTREAAPEGYPNFQPHADQHADIVLRFGRYPHRNEILGRGSSEEEKQFLASGGPSFGQKKKS
jgi:uncharacterized protein (DUF924 family)